MEFQAKELFAKHDVPGTPGIVATTPEEARAAAEKMAASCVVKAQVKAGGRGKAGGVKLAKTPDEAVGARRGHPRHGHQGPTVNRVLVAPAATSRRSTTSPSCSTAPTAYLCIASVEGGVEIEEVAETNPDAVKQSRRRRAPASTRPRPARSSPRPASPPSCPTRPPRPCSDAVEGLRRGGRHPRRGQPAGPPRPATSSRRSTARSRSTRTPTSVTRTTRSSRTRTPPTRSRRRPRTRASTTSSSTAQVGIIGNGAGLVMSHPRRRRLRR